MQLRHTQRHTELHQCFLQVLVAKINHKYIWGGPSFYDPCLRLQKKVNLQYLVNLNQMPIYSKENFKIGSACHRKRCLRPSYCISKSRSTKVNNINMVMCHLCIKLSDMYDQNPLQTSAKIVVKHIPVKALTV